MSPSTPRWWYLRHAGRGRLFRAALAPASWIWAALTARRIRSTIPRDVGIPVICVGNLTAGGAGKTPVAREILRLLSKDGIAAHALSRGHGGRLNGPVRIDPAAHSATEVGDEPLLLARDAPTWVAKDRSAGAVAAAAAGAQAIVMDDGHQNPALRKALSLVVVDGETRDGEWPFGDGAVVPAGPMREPLGVGLGRADAIVVLMPMGLKTPDPELLALLSSRPVLIARLEPSAPPPTGPQVGFAGVGKPWKVERSLKEAGCELKDFAPLADHAPLDEDLMGALQHRARDFGAGLVTTEKDWVRLPPSWRARVMAWPVRARFDDEPAVAALLDQTLSSARQPMSLR
jgi:tetraacyldisaccharide 4'-kinase